MDIWHAQIAVIVGGIAVAAVMTFRNRIIIAKLAVAVTLTAVAALQLGVTPLQRKVQRLEAQLKTMPEEDPYRPKAEHDLHAARLSLDPVEAHRHRLAKLEARHKDLQEAGAAATALAEVEEKIEAAKQDLEKAKDPEAWLQTRKVELEEQLSKLTPGNADYQKTFDALQSVEQELAGVGPRQRAIQDILPVKLGLDLSGGTEIRLRLRPDRERIEVWEQELAEIRPELETLKAETPQPVARIDELEARQKVLEQNIETAQQVIEEEFDKATEIIRRRLNSSGLAEIPVTRQGQDRVLIQLPGMDSGRANQILETIKRQGKLEFRMVVDRAEKGVDYEAVEQYIQAHPEDAGKDLRDFCIDHGRPLEPNEVEITESGRRQCKEHHSQLYDWLHTSVQRDEEEIVQPLLVKQEALVTGEHVIRARAEPNMTQPGSFQISVRLDPHGGALMEFVTANNIKKRMGIVLDGKLESAPVIQGRFGRDFRITGDFEQAESEQLEVVLKSGSLKVVPEMEFQNTVGPTLGQDSIRQGIASMLIGLGVVIVFMLVYYLVAGLVTDVLLFVNMVFIVAILSSFEATLTLPGIAGLILTVGMAVDANVLIFERIREERERGNSLPRSIQLGYERAFVTIVDANVTTLITAIILHSFGTESVQGFAITLIIGILSSMFCALVLTRWIFEALVDYKVLSDLKMLRLFRRPALNFTRVRRPAMVLSLLCIVAGLVVVGIRGKRNLGHEFTGGVLAQIALSEPLTVEAARAQAGQMGEFADVADNMQSFGAPVEGEQYEQFVLRFQPRPGQAEQGGDAGAAADEAKAEETPAGGEAPFETEDPEQKLVKRFRAAIHNAFPTLQPEGVTVGAPLPERSTPDTVFYTVDLELRDLAPPRRVQHLLATRTRLVDPQVVLAGKPLPSLPKSDRAVVRLSVLRTAVKVPEAPAEAPAEDEAEDKAEADEPARDGDAAEDDDAAKPAEAPDTAADEASDADASAAPTEAERGAAWAAAFRNACAAIEQDVFDLDAGVGTIRAVTAADEPTEFVRLRVPLTLKRPLTAGELKRVLAQAGETLARVKVSLVDPSAPVHEPSTEPAARLTVLCGVPLKDAMGRRQAEETAQQQFIRDQFQELRTSGDLAYTEPFPRFIKVGPTVAREMASSAIMALVYAMAVIFLYIWLRFQFRAAFGMGAVVALVHDVLFVLGALAVADELGLVNGQIDLVIVAALLTIVGYSLNDTIVVFDRIRENLHGGGRALEEVINTSINQTVSRTVITSVTTMLVVLALLVWGGDVIRGFAFALFVGVLVGTYSSMFIASPVLVEFAHLYAAHQKRKREQGG